MKKEDTVCKNCDSVRFYWLYMTEASECWNITEDSQPEANTDNFIICMQCGTSLPYNARLLQVIND
jgi:hypothetical protein